MEEVTFLVAHKMGECDANENPIFYEMLSYIYTKCENSLQKSGIHKKIS